MKHEHLIVRAEVNNPFTKDQLHDAEKWVSDLIKKLDMKIMFGPRAEYCDMVGNKGMTVFAIIETSHVVMHQWVESNPSLMQLDVYTCSKLNPEIVFDFLKKFNYTKLEYKFLDREEGLIEKTI